jgi:hypothetical protein
MKVRRPRITLVLKAIRNQKIYWDDEMHSKRLQVIALGGIFGLALHFAYIATAWLERILFSVLCGIIIGAIVYMSRKRQSK